jgi:hypothetical protein
MSLTRKVDVNSTLSQSVTLASGLTHWVAYVISLAIEYAITLADEYVICDMATGSLSRTADGSSSLNRTSSGASTWL